MKCGLCGCRDERYATVTSGGAFWTTCGACGRQTKTVGVIIMVLEHGIDPVAEQRANARKVAGIGGAR